MLPLAEGWLAKGFDWIEPALLPSLGFMALALCAEGRGHKYPAYE